MLIASGGLMGMNGLYCLFAIFVLILIVGLSMAFKGNYIARMKTGGHRRFGQFILVIGISLPILFCGSFINFNDREPASRRLQKGMTEEEVLAIMGKPDSIQEDTWLYYDGWLKVGFMFGVSFDKNGRFDHTWIP